VTTERRYEGDSKGEPAQITIWRTKDGEIAFLTDEEYVKEGKGRFTGTAFCVLAKPEARALAEYIIALGTD